MKVSKPVLILCIVLVLITGYIQFFTGKKKPKPPVPPAKPVQTQTQPAAPAKPGPNPAQPAQTPPASQQAAQVPAATVQPQAKPQFDKIRVGWDSDPFALPVFKESRKKGAGSAVRLVAILEKGGSRVAVIDKDVVKKGDFIGNERVAEIGADRVVLIRGGAKRTLILADPDTMAQESGPAKEQPIPAREPPAPAKDKPAERAK